MTERELFNMQVAKNVSAQLGEEVIVRITKTNKVNLTLDGLTIRRKEECIAPVIYLDPYFDRYNEGVPTERIVDDIVTVYKNTIQNGVADPFLVENFRDFDSIKDSIILTVINTERNQGLLNDVPNIPMPDLGLSVIFCVVSLAEKRSSDVIIKNEHLDIWGKDIADIITVAEKNTNKLLDFSVRTLFEILPELLDSSKDDESFDATDSDEDISEDIMRNGPILYILTSRYAMFGSGQLYLMDKIRDFALQQDCNVYVLPSSVHELILLPEFLVECDEQDLNEMVKSVNATTVAEIDFLSDNAFKYLLKEDKLVTI